MADIKDDSSFEGITEALTELSVAGSDFFVTDIDKAGDLHMTVIKDGQKVLEELHAVLKKNTLYTFAKCSDASSGLEPLDTLNIDGCKAKIGSVPEQIELEEVPGLSLNLNSTRVSSFTSKRWLFKAASGEEASDWLKNLNKYVGVQSGTQLDTSQTEAIEKLRTKLSSNPDVSVKPDSKTLLRYLNGKQWDVDAAAALYIETLAWRKQFGVDTISSESISTVLRSGMFQIPPGMTDKKGRPMLILRAGRFDPNTLKLLDVIRTFIYMVEGALAHRPPGSEQFTIVVDYSNMSRSNFDPRLPRYCLNFIQNYHIGLVGSILIVNQPLFFRVVWSVISQWIEPALRGIIHIVGDAKKNLRSFVDPDQCWTEYGGVLEYDHAKWVNQHIEASKNMGSSAINASVQLAFSDVPADQIKNATKTGWLTKQGGVVKNWKKRYCVLVDKVLFYYSGKESAKPQGYVDLNKTTIDPNGQPSKKHSFTVNAPSRVWIFVANDDNEKAEWVKALQTAVDN
jgi:hypothetical protein